MNDDNPFALNVLVLTAEEIEQFVRDALNPPPPTPSMIRAAKKYDDLRRRYAKAAIARARSGSRP